MTRRWLADWIGPALALVSCLLGIGALWVLALTGGPV